MPQEVHNIRTAAAAVVVFVGVVVGVVDSA